MSIPAAFKACRTCFDAALVPRFVCRFVLLARFAIAHTPRRASVAGKSDTVYACVQVTAPKKLARR
jgi:hypothetical protein